MICVMALIWYIDLMRFLLTSLNLLISTEICVTLEVWHD
jgi:hypothetical protein